MTTEIIDAQKSEIAAFSPFYADLATLEKDNAATVFDYESRGGNKDARSHVHKLRKTKGALEKVRKEAKADYLRLGRAVDSEASEIEARIEAMIEVHQAELDKIEQREADRVAAQKERVQWFGIMGADAVTSDELSKVIERVESEIIGDDYEEFKQDALALKDSSLQALRARRLDAIKKEGEAAELERLRAESEARKKADHEAAIARAAEEGAKAAAAKEAERVSAEQQRALQEAENKARAEREASERRELELRLAAENAERRRVEQEQRAEQDRKDAVARAAQQAAAAVEAEKQRVAAAQAAEAAEQAKRESNRAHKAKINGAALAAFVAGGMTEECAKLAVTLIASGKIPAATISY